MVADAVLFKIASSVVSMVLRSPLVKDTALRAVGREPMQLAVKRALTSAVTELEQQYPKWVEALFDASFLEQEAAPVLAAVLTRGQDATSSALARRYVQSLTPLGERLPLVRAVEPAATCFLEAFTSAVKSEHAVWEVLDAKAL